MSAGTLGIDQGLEHITAAQNHPPKRAGYTRISTGTLQRLVTAIAAEAFHVPAGTVRAGIHDDQGLMGVRLALPLAMGPLTANGSKTMANGVTGMDDGGTVFERAASARAVVALRIHALAGSSVGRVDIRFTGIHEGKPLLGGRVK